MTKAFVTSRAGVEREIAAPDGVSLMESIRDAGIYEVLALCGGCCSCGTCHVHVAEEWRDRVGPAKGPERELLELSPHWADGSRLSCQISMTAALHGVRVRIAPED